MDDYQALKSRGLLGKNGICQNCQVGALLRSRAGDSTMISFKETLVFSSDIASPVDLLNFWPPESDFVWSTGRWCEVQFDFSDTGRRVERSDLIIDLDAFKRDGAAPMIALYLNGIRIGTAQIAARMIVAINFATSILRPIGNVLIIDTPEILSPADVGFEDERLLGVQLFSAQIRPS